MLGLVLHSSSSSLIIWGVIRTSRIQAHVYPYDIWAHARVINLMFCLIPSVGNQYVTEVQQKNLKRKLAKPMEIFKGMWKEGVCLKRISLARLRSLPAHICMWCFVNRLQIDVYFVRAKIKSLEMAAGIKLGILNKLRLEGKYIDMVILVIGVFLYKIWHYVILILNNIV